MMVRPTAASPPAFNVPRVRRVTEGWIDHTPQHGIAQKHRNKVFEVGTYYSDEWLLPHWVVAESDGLFKHDEIGEGHERKYI